MHSGTLTTPVTQCDQYRHPQRKTGPEPPFGHELDLLGHGLDLNKIAASWSPHA
jgi:hypothetical protein